MAYVNTIDGVNRVPFVQRVENLPQELLQEARFVKLAKYMYTDASKLNKAPQHNWQDPYTQRKYNDIIDCYVSFVITRSGYDAFTFYNIDNVLDDAGNFVNETAESWYRTLHIDGTYCEKSLSGRGLHIFTKTNRLDDLLSGTYTLTLDPNNPDCKITIYHGTDMSCIVTGDCFNCQPNAPIARNEVADELYIKILTAANVALPPYMNIAAINAPRTINLPTPQHVPGPIVRANYKFRDDLNRDELERVKGELRKLPKEEIAYRLGIPAAHKSGYVCPECGNGSGDNGTGISPKELDGHLEWHCYKCGRSWDNIGLIARYFNLSQNGKDFWEIVKKGAELFGIGYTSTGELFIPKPVARVQDKADKPAQDDKPVKDYTNFYNNVARPNLPKFLDQCGGKWRNLTRETLEYFYVGYTPQFKPADTPAVIIPYSKNHFFARFVGDKDKLTAEQKEKLREKYHTVGAKPVFNAKRALRGLNPICFVVESATDAMSIYQAGGYNVIAISGSSLSDHMRKQIEPFGAKDFIIMLDGDETGQVKKQKLVEQLTDLGHQATPVVLSDKFKDANDFLQADPDGLAARLREIYNAAEYTFSTQKSIKNVITQTAPPEPPKPVEPAPSQPLAPEVAEWQELNGTIDPMVLLKLAVAKDYLEKFTPETITAGVAQNSKTKQALALCQFYDCYIDAHDNFLANLSIAKNIATNKIKTLKAAGGDFITDNIPAKLVALSSLGIAELRASVKSMVSALAKAHKKFLGSEEQRKVREEADRKREHHLIELGRSEERLARLKLLPPSDERNAQIIETIKQMCSWLHDRLGNPTKIETTQANSDIIFRNDPYLDGLVAFDEFQQSYVFLKPAPWNKEAQHGDEWRVTDDAQLRVYLSRTYAEFGNKDIIADNLIDYSLTRKFHVIREYFNKLPNWDGKPRAETFFIDWLKVADTPYARNATMNWLLGAVSRVFHPGCRYQTVLVIPGEQGVGKSYCLERLGAGWYDALTDSLDDPHALDAIQKMWIVELKEGSAWKKADVDAQKRFFDASKDTRRFSYLPRAITVPRRCVFAITLNNKQFLSDLTGNRRYMILQSLTASNRDYPTEIRGEKLTDDKLIKQIWAEVFVRYKELFADKFDDKRLELDKYMKQQVEEIAENYLRDDGLQGEIKAFLDTKILPPVIWDKLSKDERYQFMTSGRLFVYLDDLVARITAHGGRNAKKDIRTVQKMFEDESDGVKKIPDPMGVPRFCIYGTAYRQTVCVAEITTEGFAKNDRRINPTRVLELLSNMKGWKQGKRKCRYSVYGDQKTIYYRNPDNIPNPDGDDEQETNADTNTSIAMTNNAPRSQQEHAAPATAQIETASQSGSSIAATSWKDDFVGEPIDPNDSPF